MMQKFFIRINRGTEPRTLNFFKVGDLPVNNVTEGLYLASPDGFIKFENPVSSTWIFGDIITRPGKMDFTGEEKDISTYFKTLKGTFYIVRINHIESSIEVASSIFGIFPVYYMTSGNTVFISSDLNLFTSTLGNKEFTISQRFILETMLFNYPLFDRTIFEEIRSIPANSKLIIYKDKFLVKKYLDIATQFESNPVPYRKYTGELSDYMINTVKDYFPEEPFNITFTGGFDGRTLVSCAKYYGCDFSTFSLGKLKNDDVYLPIEHAKKIGITHIPIYLDNPGYIDAFLQTGKDLVELSGLLTNLSYTHFLYASRLISQSCNYLLTGFGGSEIFRSLDIRGAVTSHELVDFFEFSKGYRWKDLIRNSGKLRLLGSSYHDEIDSLIADLESYQASSRSGFGLSERIYIYLYEEVFRKVYGPIIRSMSNEIIVRNPYMDYSFNSELLKYSIAGLYSKFFVKNPIKRYKGQVLYGHVIKKTSPVLAGLVTGKGYKPVDLTNYKGLVNITYNFFRKRMVRNITHEDLDNLSLISAFEKNKDLFIRLLNESEYFNPGEVEILLNSKSYIVNSKERDLLLFAFTIMLYLDMHHA